MLCGCVATPTGDASLNIITPSNVVIEPVSLLRNQPGPPLVESYKDIAINHKVMFQYLDDLNWWMFYMYSYVRTANNYGKEFGWISPTWLPLCRYWEPLNLPPLPGFEIAMDDSYDPDDFEWLMANYINEIKIMYNAGDRAIKEESIRQRTLCLY